MLKTKSAKSPIDRGKDGLRILATRYRGRYMPTSRYDIWMPSLAPSERLLKTAQAGRISASEFFRRYRKEMLLDGPIEARSPNVGNHGQEFTLRLLQKLARKGSFTVMCHCPEGSERCHRSVLKKLIDRA